MTNKEDEALPILDMSAFPVITPPGEIYRMLDAQNPALDKLLGLEKLADDFSKSVRKKYRKAKKGTLWLSDWLRPRAQTKHDIVAVHLSLAAITNESTVQIRVYLVEFDRFEELRQFLHAKMVKIGKEMEVFRSGLSGRN